MRRDAVTAPGRRRPVPIRPGDVWPSRRDPIRWSTRTRKNRTHHCGSGRAGWISTIPTGTSSGTRGPKEDLLGHMPVKPRPTEEEEERAMTPTSWASRRRDGWAIARTRQEYRDFFFGAGWLGDAGDAPGGYVNRNGFALHAQEQPPMRARHVREHERLPNDGLGCHGLRRPTPRLELRYVRDHVTRRADVTT